MPRVPNERREDDARVLLRWLGLAGPPQRHSWDYPEGDRSWTREARCGSWNEDAPDPETFYPLSPDSVETYRAQLICRECPVRELCFADGQRTKAPGIWGGVYRSDRGELALLCATAGCLRYRTGRLVWCGACIRARHPEPDPAPAVVEDRVREVVAA